MQKGTGCDGLCRSMAERSYPSPKVRGGGLEEQPHVHGELAAQEGREELLQVPGQEGRLGGDTLVQGKRNPSKMVGVARGHQRTDTLKP